MIQGLRNLYKPENFHGFAKKDNFFEGWYYKVSSLTNDTTLSIIPGIFISKNVASHESFIQIRSSIEHKSHFVKFPPEAFEASKTEFDIKIDKNSFNFYSLELDIDTAECKAHGRLGFSGHYPWGKSLLSPGVMGKFSFVPFMETFHGVLSMNHTVNGSMELNGKRIDSKDAKGYMEKDWGRSFPAAYLWLQSNNFDAPATSVFISIAKIPWLGKWFTGFIAGFLLDGELHKFATYNSAKLSKFTFADGSTPRAEIAINRGNKTLRVRGEMLGGFELKAPYNNSMNNIIHESLESELEVELLIDGLTAFKGKSRLSGFEYNGDLAQLTTNNL